MALVAMSASAAPAARALDRESLAESRMVRAVGAAVAAAARDLVGTERCSMAVGLAEPQTPAGPVGISPAGPVTVTWAPPELLGERMLDLPPPAC